MIIYILILLALLFSKTIEKKESKGIIQYILLWSILIIIVGLQYRMGGDNLSYEDDFKMMASLKRLSSDDFSIGSRFQPLWLVFVGLVKNISDSYTFYHFIHAIFLNSIFATLFFKQTKNKFTATLLFFVSFEFFFFNIELQRESLAVATFCLAYYQLIKEKYINYYILAVIAFLFHASATFLFFIPPVYCLYKNGYIKLLFVILLVVGIGLTAIKEFMMDLGFSVIDNLNNQVSYYSEQEVNRTNAFVLAIFTCIPFLIFIKLKQFDTSKTDFFYFCTILYCVFTISNVFDTISFRFCNYMLPFVLIYMATIIGNTPKKQKKYLYVAFVFLTILYVYKYTLPAPFIRPDAKMYEMYIPYRSVLFN